MVTVEGLNPTKSKVTNLEERRVYKAEYQGDTCLFFITNDKCVRIDGGGALSYSGRVHYEAVCNNIVDVTDKVKIIVEE